MNLTNAHTFNLSSQGSIYTQTVIRLIDGSSKLLVATLNRKVFCFDLSMTHLARPCGCVVVPQTQELQFTYLPGGAEIISIDAFNRSTETNDFVIGVTIIKSGDSGSPGQYINIYSEWEPGTELQLDTDSLAHSCLSLELGFVPYQLGHCRVQGNVFWFLGGSDHRIHTFSEDKLRHTYTELDGDLGLIEFAEPLPSIPLYTDVYSLNGHRTTATVCENGFVKLTVADEVKNEILKVWTSSYDGPLTSVFIIKPDDSRDALLPLFLKKEMPLREDSKSLSMVVTNGVSSCLVFSDITSEGLNKPDVLEESDKYDCVTSCWVADLTFDGNLTVLLGTYGQELLAYRRVDKAWRLVWQKSLAAPVIGIRYEDLTGDGVKEIIVITTRGVQILQHDLLAVKETALKRLNKLLDLTDI